ncbi:hypothetical protein B0H10DRAFT_2441881 [Mycena sp. CBHHK59/15]|nr:hypothetical protein B0H10DRAFT_2441881 [Mycena sp. CBHHK59/15]
MSAPDWSKVQVDLHPDSPWLRTLPTETALQDFFPDLVFHPSEVRDSAAFAAGVEGRTLFGHPANIKPIKPEANQYTFEPSELSCAPPPSFHMLIPPSSHPDDPPPPKNFMYPKVATFTLKKTCAYQRGYVYTTPYYLNAKDDDYARMMRVVIPPQLYPRNIEEQYVHDAVPECVQMVPGVPFAFEIEGREDELHTIDAVHTFESLRHEKDFWDIYKDTVLVAKGLRGCQPSGNSDEVFPIADFPIKTNDRSPANVPDGCKVGSFNLANTLLKGIGRGVVLPAAQVDTSEFSGQISTVLQCLGRLRRRLLRKTLSKYEYEATKFNSDDMNVVGFGGLELNNATSCQLNMSALWQSLVKALGIQGGEHPDSKDEETRKTYLLLLFNLPPGSDPGAFLLARAGLYLRELDTWALHIFFDGTDIHAGAGGETTLSVPQFQQWVETELETAWKHSELGRMGIVQYAMRSAHNWDTHMSMTPSVRFGNVGPELPANVRDFATHGQEILGGQEPWANRMGREIIYNFWNQLQLCNLDLEIDIDTLLQSITFNNSAAERIHLKPLPFHPKRDAEAIALKRGHFEYLRQRCASKHIYIEKWQFLQFRQALAGKNPADERDCLSVQWPSRSSISTKSIQNSLLSCGDFQGSVVKILDYVRIGNQCCYRVLTDDTDPTPKFIQQNDERLPVKMVDQFLAAEVQKGENAGSKSGEIPVVEAASDDMEYNVEKICDVRQDSNGTWYYCKFVGFAKKEWVHVNNLSNECDILLKGFYASLASESEKSDSADKSSDSDSDAAPKRKKRKITKPPEKSVKISAVSLEHTEHLEALLNVDRLSIEVAEVKEGRPTQGRASRMFFSALASPMLVANILDTCSKQSQSLTMLELVIDNQRSSKLTTASTEFTKLASLAGAISQVTAYEKVTSLLTRILRWTSDDGIFSSQALDTVIHSPWLSFPISRADHLGPALLHRAEITLAPLKAWLSDCLEETPLIQAFAKELGDEIHFVLLEMNAGEPHPDTIKSIQEAAAKKPVRTIKSRPKKIRILTYNRPVLDTIVPVAPPLALYWQLWSFGRL